MSTEPILNPENFRFTIYPIKYQKVWDSYKKQLACFWKAEEVDFSEDFHAFQKLNEDEKHFIKQNLAFFAASDGIVNFNISERFMKDIQIVEAKVAYSFQMMMENVHGELYSLMLDNIVRDTQEKEYLFNAIKNVDSVRKMSEWAMKWIDSDKSFAHRLIAFAVVEGVFFSGAFASIFWIKKYKPNIMNGLIKGNEFIARDEGLHRDFACILYELLENKISRSEILEIITEGVSIAKTFIQDSLPVRLIGMNEGSMCEYIEYVADCLIVELGEAKHYNAKNPFPFMETIGMVQKTNFFESRPTEYQSAHVLGNKNISFGGDEEDF